MMYNQIFVTFFVDHDNIIIQCTDFSNILANILNHHSQVLVQCPYNAGTTLYNATVPSVGFLDGW